MANIKCYLSDLMGKRKMDIQEVHVKTGLNRNTISGLYNEKVKRVDFETLIKLCKLFECNIGDLLDFQDDEPEETNS
ncbi:MAG: hypothetical protein BWY74_00008 [Firmicutes bacterium ADurb.Bin419]|nr:MAG: hypothetical protein BWY74_00008 [Firmicutes bacterium ADurb.Bin419]